MPWDEIAQALHEVGFDGNVVMEPFVRPGGIVGSDVKLWRDLSGGADEETLTSAGRPMPVVSVIPRMDVRLRSL